MPVQIDEDDMKYLLESLKDKDPHVRVFTINSIVDNKDRLQAFPDIIKLLLDDSEAVRCRAAWALGKIGNLKALDHLIQALNDVNIDVRKNVIRSLGELMAFDAIPNLILKLRDENWEVRAEVAVVLEYLGWVPGNKNEEAILLIARGKWEDLIKMKDIDMNLLLSFLNDDDRETRSKVAWVAGEYGNKKATQPLFDLFMTDNFQDVKESSSNALSKIGGKETMDLLLVALHDEDWFVRKSAATALGFMKDDSSISALKALLEDDNTFVSKSAAKALQQIKEKKE